MTTHHLYRCTQAAVCEATLCLGKTHGTLHELADLPPCASVERCGYRDDETCPNCGGRTNYYARQIGGLRIVCGCGTTSKLIPNGGLKK